MPSEDGTPPLRLNREEMRTLGYQVVDMLVDHVDTVPEESVPHIASREELEASLWEPIPETGTSPAEVLNQLQDDVFANISHVDHPRFFAFIPSPSNFVGAMADALASGFNVFSGTWIESSGPSMIELVTIDWLRRLCGMPKTAGGLFTSGGSMANFTALAAARHIRLDDEVEGAVIYTSDQTHSAIDRALYLLGFSDSQLRALPSDDRYRLDLSALRHAVLEDRKAGRTPFCVVANAGTTNTGAIDPLEPLADLCEAEDLWLHVDGAYGAAAVLTDEGRTLLSGMGRAHSLALDPHKWLFQPYEIGGMLVRKRRWLKKTFHVLPEYLEDTVRSDKQEVNFADYGPQLTRRFRALKLWFSLKVFGLDAFREAITQGLRRAEAAEEKVRTMPGWEVVTSAQLGLVTFRYAPKGTSLKQRNALNQRLVDRMERDGFAMLSTTKLQDRLVIRLCPINPRTTQDDLHSTLDRLDAFARASH